MLVSCASLIAMTSLFNPRINKIIVNCVYIGKLSVIFCWSDINITSSFDSRISMSKIWAAGFWLMPTFMLLYSVHLLFSTISFNGGVCVPIDHILYMNFFIFDFIFKLSPFILIFLFRYSFPWMNLNLCFAGSLDDVMLVGDIQGRKRKMGWGGPWNDVYLVACAGRDRRVSIHRHLVINYNSESNIPFHIVFIWFCWGLVRVLSFIEVIDALHPRVLAGIFRLQVCHFKI